jgi:hypothetical protein
MVPELLDAGDDLHHSCLASAPRPGNIGCREERLFFRGHDNSKRPAAPTGHGLSHAHVHLVYVRSLFAVHLYADEGLIHEGCDSLVFKGLMGHYMAPVAGGVAHGKEDGLVLPGCGLEGLIAPGVPVHGVKGVLEKIGAFLGEKAVGWMYGYRLVLIGKRIFDHGNLTLLLLA